MKILSLCVLLSLPALAAGGSQVPGCPAVAEIKPEWVEHTDPAAMAGRWEAHLRSAQAKAGPILVPVHRVQNFFGVSRRGDLLGQGGREPGCFVTGTVAYYVMGEEGNPEIDFGTIAAQGREGSLLSRLIELRWFDPADGRRHRWYNMGLARQRGFLVDELGRPTPEYRPIETYTSSPNELY
ncbi:MAG: hypothetical protein HZB91_01685 [Elusimicrobia bacterium]|nr:hypothetical protein [Elusimicrobiota bacterium]